MIATMASNDPRARLINSMLDRHRLSFRWLASKVNASHVSVSKWLSGDAKPRDEKTWNRMIEVLRDYESQQRGNREIDLVKTGIREIMIYPGISAGAMNRTHSHLFTIEVKDWGTTSDRWGRTIDGFSMSSPELPNGGLMPGDIVVFEDRPWEPNHVVQAEDTVTGEDTVKIVRGSGHALKLYPANLDYEPIDAANKRIKGVVVMHIRRGPHGETTTTEYPHGMRIVPPHKI